MKEVNGYNPSKDPRLIDCKTECGNGKCYARRYGLFAEKTCPNFVEPKQQTNADRIHAMDTADLAALCASPCPPDQQCGRNMCYPLPECVECWKKWLESEVDNGT